MKITIASGKGGTGKTMIATNLAYLLARNGRSIVYLDCDVEEPNGYLFFRETETASFAVNVPIPGIDMSVCTRCGRCTDICAFGALISAGDDIMVIPELCHSCGGCVLVCPQQAISEKPREIGQVFSVKTDNVYDLDLHYGLLAIGETGTVSVIKAVKHKADTADCTIIDSPPGTSCPVMEAVKDSDFVVLVTEPTPFGLHDLQLAVEMLRLLEIPFGVVINQVGLGDDRVHGYCRNENIPILMEMPHDRKIAEVYSRGDLVLAELPEYTSRFHGLVNAIEGLAQ